MGQASQPINKKQALATAGPSSAQYSADDAHINETVRTGEYVGTLRWDDKTKMMPLPRCPGTLFGVELDGEWGEVVLQYRCCFARTVSMLCVVLVCLYTQGGRIGWRTAYQRTRMATLLSSRHC